MITKTSRANRPGAAYVLALVLLVVFMAMAAAFSSLTSLNARMSDNTADLHRARATAEGGLAFAANVIRSLRLPYDTDDSNVMPNLAAALSEKLDATANLAGAAVTYTGGSISVPSISTDDGRFEIFITQSADQKLTMQICGLADGARAAVAVGLVYNTNPVNTAFGYGIASNGPISIDGNAEIRGQNQLTEASVISVTEQDVAVSVGGSSILDGDISSVGADTSVVISGSPTIAGSQDPAVIAQHVHFDVDAPIFPIVDTTIFRPLATAVIDAGTDTSQKGTVFNNPIIKAGVNPTFASDVVLNGVVYIEAPNIVNFAGKVTLNGLLATDDTELGINSCKITFAGQVDAFGVGALPDEPQFLPAKALTGTFIAAPGFDVSFAGQFTTINGTIAADKLTFSGQAEGTVEGSVIGLADYPVSIHGTVNIYIDQSGGHDDDAGFHLPVLLDVEAGTYREITPTTPG